MYFVYVLRSIKNGRLYTGSTENVAGRVQEHNDGRSKYTRLTRPFVVVYTEKYNTRSEAVRREKFLKTGKGRELINQLLQKNMRL